MIIWWFKSILSYKPSWWKNYKVKSCSSIIKLNKYPSIADLQVITVKIDGSG
jgi:hypothetical protein